MFAFDGMSPLSSSVHLENVTYRYRDDRRAALRNLTLHVNPGETLCVMGANGSGKSTLAKVLAGLLEPNQGRVQIDVERSTPMPVGILFQNPDNQMVSVTVEKEVAFALENLGVPLSEMEERITETLARFSIEHLRRRLTSELSGGEKQRVALAAVMVCRPPVLVLDEPDSFLDEPGKTMLMQELKKLRADNPLMIQIHITQYPSVAVHYPRLIVLDGGFVAADGDPRQVFRNRSLCAQTGLDFPAASARRIALPRDVATLSREPRSVHKVAVRQVSFQYSGEDRILSHISFDLHAGEVLGLVGPSGSGKTTLGLLLTGLLSPAAGSIEYLGREGRPLSSDQLAGMVSMVFQQPERQFFLPSCSAEIAFGPKNLGRHMSESDVGTFLAMVGLEPETFLEKDPFTLSGGEKRRLAFAAVLSMWPRIVVFDEPTCGLDQEGVGRFVALVRELRSHGFGLVIISHDGDLIRTLSSSVLSLKADGSWREYTCREFFTGNAWEGTVSPPAEVQSLPAG